jgi:hypothetical protein
MLLEPLGLDQRFGVCVFRAHANSMKLCRNAASRFAADPPLPNEGL